MLCKLCCSYFFYLMSQNLFLLPIFSSPVGGSIARVTHRFKRRRHDTLANCKTLQKMEAILFSAKTVVDFLGILAI